MSTEEAGIAAPEEPQEVVAQEADEQILPLTDETANAAVDAAAVSEDQAEAGPNADDASLAERRDPPIQEEDANRNESADNALNVGEVPADGVESLSPATDSVAPVGEAVSDVEAVEETAGSTPFEVQANASEDPVAKEKDPAALPHEATESAAPHPEEVPTAEQRESPQRPVREASSENVDAENFFSPETQVALAHAERSAAPLASAEDAADEGTEGEGTAVALPSAERSSDLAETTAAPAEDLQHNPPQPDEGPSNKVESAPAGQQEGNGQGNGDASDGLTAVPVTTAEMARDASATSAREDVGTANVHEEDRDPSGPAAEPRQPVAEEPLPRNSATQVAPAQSPESPPAPYHAVNMDDDSYYLTRPLTAASITHIQDSVPTAQELALAELAAQENGTHVLAAFRRGYDNSHINRMQQGSYSRYLQSTRTVTEPQRLVDTFLGTAPSVGTVPRNVASARSTSPPNASQNPSTTLADTHRSLQSSLPPENSRMTATMPSGTYRAGSTRAASGRGIALSSYGCTTIRPAPDGTSASRATNFSCTARSTGTGGTMLRREVELLDNDPYNELVAQRDRRRHQFRRGQPENPKEQLDYVYYNHRSKGYYVPVEQPTDALRLQYNHLFDYGPDGTRMTGRTATTACDRSVSGHGAPEGDGPACRLNPHAQPPKTFGQTRGLSWKLRSGRVASRTTPTRAAAASTTAATTAEPPRNAVGPASSLRTARAVDVSKLHNSQCRHTRTLEDVIAANPLATARTSEGLAAAVRAGKLKEEEMPAIAAPRLRAATGHAHSVSFALDRADATTASGLDGAPAAGGRERRAEGGLPHLPDNAKRDTTGGTSLLPKKPYEVSRLTYTTRQDRELTPSAYVK